MSKPISRLHLGALLFFLLAGGLLAGSDWPQYRGPNHDGTSPEKILKKWPAGGPAQIWKVPLTDGFSAISVGGGGAFTLVSREVEGASQEVCFALDAATGKEKWSAPLGVGKYDQGGNSGAAGNDGGDGPRSTPAYSDGKVYAYSSRLVLKCFDAATGKTLWSSDIIADHGGNNIHWGNAASPLVEGNLVIVPGGGPGQAFLAFNKKDGQVVWKTGDDKLTQSTPVAATILGVRQVLFMTDNGLVSLKAADGEVLWRDAFRITRAVGMSPVVSGDLVYCSVAYNLGSRVCKISREGDKFSASELWFVPGNSIANHWSTPVCTGGYLYGLFGQAKYAEAPLECVELANGKVRWSKRGFGPGGCVLVDGHLLVLSDAGDLVLVEAKPDEYAEVARSHILDGKCWNGVGISNGRIYARSTREGVCLDVSPKTAMK